MLMPILIVTGTPIVSSVQSFAVVLYMSIVPMFLGYVLFGFGLTKVAASTATTITLVEPAVAALLGVFVVGERLTVSGWMGLAAFAAVLLAMALSPESDEAVNLHSSS